MGYGYRFKLVVEENGVMADDSEEMIAAYKILKKREWFPTLDKKRCDGAGTYGCGEIHKDGMNYPLDELILLTQQFPNLVFTFFFFYNDYCSFWFS